MVAEPPRRLLLLRHGRTAWNHAGRAQGHADVGLDETGRAQAAGVAPHVAAMRPTALWTSDLARARQTCDHVERATGLVAEVDPRLREYDVGERQGTTPAEFERRWPEAFAAWSTGADDVRVPGAESHGEVVSRVVPVLRACLDALGPGGTGVVVGHGAALRRAVVALLGWDGARFADLVALDNCAWAEVVLTATGRHRLAAWNRHGRPVAP